MSDVTRREAILFAGACACCAMSANSAEADDNGPPGGDGPGHRPGHDRDGGDRPGKPAGPMVKSLVIGTLADFPNPGFSDKFRANKVMIARLDDRLVAMTSVCTHKGCSVKVKPDDKTALKCPCHRAEFSEQGTPTAGPARTALDRYALTQAADGTITADLTKNFIESKWEDPAAFIPIPTAATKPAN